MAGGRWEEKPELQEQFCGIVWYCLHSDGLVSCRVVSSKELWPVMDKWIKYRKGHSNIAYTPDVIVASVLRLIGKFLFDCLCHPCSC